jgi:transcriptional regulator with XRE-family HTH domain
MKMGQPQRLAEKLRQVRVDLGLTQEAMFEALSGAISRGGIIHQGYITRYETGARVPSLLVLLAYAKIGKISVDVLIDDDVDIS